MMFASPAILIALPAMTIPIILYLIFKRRRRDVPWGAIYILRRVLETRSQTSAWLQYLIIALRTLALAALILAFASPHAAWTPPADDMFPAAPPATHRVILLDTSQSMQARAQAGTAFDAALSLSRRILSSGIAPGQIDLLPLDGREQPLSFRRWPADNVAMEDALAQCLPSNAPARLRTGLRQAIEIFQASPWQTRELYMLGDFLAADLRDDVPEICRSLGRLHDMGVTLHPVRFASSESMNFALMEMGPAVDVLLRNQPCLFRLRVGGFPTAAREEEAAAAPDTILTLTGNDGTVLARETFPLATGEKVISLPLTLPPGRHAVTARLRSDALGFDNELVQSYEVLTELRAMVVQNIVRETGFDNPRTWLSDAFANPTAGSNEAQAKFANARDAFQAHAQAVQTEAERNRADDLNAPFSIVFEGKIPEQVNADLFAAAHLVILLDIDSMPEESVRDLETYALRGGTVLLAPGAKADAMRFNESFGRIAPASLTPPNRREIDPERYEQCLVEASDEPLWRELDSPEHGNLASARFYNYYPAASAKEDATTLLRLSDGAPLLQTRAVGRGSIMLWTAGLGGDWHSLVVHPGYPVLLIRLLQQAAARRTFPANLAPGEPLLLEAEVKAARFVRPDGTSEIVESRNVGGRSILRYDNTTQPGTYEVRLDLQSEVPGLLYHVQGGTGESDLRPLARDARDRLEDAAQTPLCDTEAALVRRLGDHYGGPSHALTSILIAVACFLAEAGLTRKVFL